MFTGAGAHNCWAVKGLESCQLNVLAGDEREARKVAKAFGIAVRHAGDGSSLAGGEVDQATPGSRGELEVPIRNRVTVRVVSWEAERFVDARLELL